MTDPLLITTLAVICGSVLNTVRGYVNSDGEPYSIKKFSGAIIVAVFAGLAVAQTLSIANLGITEMILIGLTIGFSVDYAVSKAKKELA
jgi:hypothetical protein|tara:strand:- start:341 stop:607 length:267 start_codon:yes stop_codon:yes gene_type:complete